MAFLQAEQKKRQLSMESYFEDSNSKRIFTFLSQHDLHILTHLLAPFKWLGPDRAPEWAQTALETPIAPTWNTPIQRPSSTVSHRSFVSLRSSAPGIARSVGMGVISADACVFAPRIYYIAGDVGRPDGIGIVLDPATFLPFTVSHPRVSALRVP